MICESPRTGPLGGEIPVESLRHLGAAPLVEGRSWRLLGQDGGQTVDLGGGETLFLFSDTLIRTEEAGQVLLANCAARASAPTLPRALAGLRFYEDARGWPRPILRLTAEEKRRNMRLWPAHGCLLDGRVHLFYLGIEFFNPQSDWGFRNLGAGLAVLDPATGDAVRVRRQGDWCLWRARGDDFHFGVQTLREKDWLYVYSSTRHGFLSEAGLARVEAARAADPDAYSFLDAQDTWTPRQADAASLGPAGNDFSVSWNEYLERYLMVFVDPYAKRLHLRHAAAPWGPWSPPQDLGELPHEAHSELIFLGLEHPCFAEDGGRTVHITYGQPHFVQNSLLALTFA